MKTHPGSRRLGILTLAIAFGAAGVVACGDDEKSSAKSKEGYCAIEQQIDDSFESAFSGLGDSPTDEQVMTAMADVSSTVIDKFADDALAAAPEQIAEDVAVLFAATQKAADGDLSAFDDPETDAAANRVDDFCFGPEP